MTEQHTPMPAQDRGPVSGPGHVGPATHDPRTPWSGRVRFGGIAMVVVGAFAVLEGILALALPTTYISSDGTVLAIDFAGWAWIHMILGVLVLATGLSLFGRTVPDWARGAGAALVALNMLVQLTWMPAYPIWAIILLALDVFVLYALLVTWCDTQL